jgi:tyrosine-protein phosphatase
MKRGKGHSPRDSDASSLAEDEEEWTRRRRLLDEAPDHGQNDRESVIVKQEAEALDKAMEDRIVARKSSASSMSSIGSASGSGMGSAWKSRYSRKRTHSTASIKTNRSMDEDLVEEEEEEALLGIGGDFDHDSHQTEEYSSSSSPDDENKGTPRNPSYLSIQPPLTAGVWKTNFTCSSPLTAVAATFDAPLPRPSPPKPKVKRRPVSLCILPPVPASPIGLAVETDDILDPKESTGGAKRIVLPIRRQSESRILRPHSHRQNATLQKGIPTSYSTDSVSTAAGTPSQTLFVFPPSPTFINTRTPSVMTLLSNPSVPIPFSMLQTPRVSTFNNKGKRRSFIGLTSSPAPTVGLAKVDARGYVGLEVSSL